MANNLQPIVPIQPAAAQIQQPGNRRLLQITNQITNGLLVSHILNVKVSNEPQDPNHARQIRREIKQQIWNVQNLHFVMHNGQPFPVGITWTMVDAGQTCACYYAVNLPYADSVVENHTRVMLNAIVNNIRQNHPQYGNHWGIAYLVTRPLAIFQPIPSVPIVGAPAVQQIGNFAQVGDQIVIDNAGVDEDDEDEEEKTDWENGVVRDALSRSFIGTVQNLDDPDLFVLCAQLAD
eukprot:gene33704-40776_t